ncbi:MAG: hypothetical protein NZ898_05110 [Myxococcota bacterium]|nr:hypothetical protein [Myxococcota bacterium]MDW8362316.1 hypothetical protein [Myxococcales bacterium]
MNKGSRFMGLVFVAFATCAVQPATSRAVELYSEGGFRWEFYEATGELSGASGVLMRLSINHIDYSTPEPVGMTDEGRTIVFGEARMGAGYALRVHRRVHVPRGGGDFARYLDVIENTSSVMQSVSVKISSYFFTDKWTVVHATSSGDTALSARDVWFAVDDTEDGAGHPAVAFVFQGLERPAVEVANAERYGHEDFHWTFVATVPPGGRIAFLWFVIQATTRTASVAQASRLADAPREALHGLDDFVDDVVNFRIGSSPTIDGGIVDGGAHDGSSPPTDASTDRAAPAPDAGGGDAPHRGRRGSRGRGACHIAWGGAVPMRERPVVAFALLTSVAWSARRLRSGASGRRHWRRPTHGTSVVNRP